jgi:hypothetical protein
MKVNLILGPQSEQVKNIAQRHIRKIIISKLEKGEAV